MTYFNIINIHQLKNFKKMKKLLLLTCIIYSIVAAKAQTGPTKEETLDYIKSYFKEDYFRNGQLKFYYTPGTSEKYQGYKITNIYFVDCTMHVAFEKFSSYSSRPDWETKEYFKSDIDMSKVVSIAEIKFNGNGNDLAALKFKDKGNTNASEIDLPFAVVSKNTEISQTKLFKAFNHLRKLCGAPEPIEF